MDEANEIVLQHLRALDVSDAVADKVREELARARQEPRTKSGEGSSLVRLLSGSGPDLPLAALAKPVRREGTECDSIGGDSGVGPMPCSGGREHVSIPWSLGEDQPALDVIGRVGADNSLNAWPMPAVSNAWPLQATGSSPREQAQLGDWPAQVTLHVYDLGPSGGCRALNNVLSIAGMGVFHCGVEVYGREWSFRHCMEGTGVFCCRPRCCQGQSYCESIIMGPTSLPKCDVLRLIAVLSKKWLGSDYSALKKNCCHFCKELCRLLNVGAVPEHLTAAAAAGEHLEHTGRSYRAMLVRKLRDRVCCSTPCCEALEVEEVPMEVETAPSVALPSNTARPSQTLPVQLEKALIEEYCSTQRHSMSR